MLKASTSKWYIPSNRGTADIIFECLNPRQESEEIEFCVTLCGKSWENQSLESEPPEFIEVPNLRLELFQVVFPLTACQELLEKFDAWLSSPEHFGCTLCSRPGIEVEVEVGQREGYIYEPERPTLTLNCREGSFCAEYFFQVDQSCIRIAHDGLAFVLESFTQGASD